MMRKSLVVLAIFSAISVPAAAQTAPAANQAQPARPQTVKKIVCQRVDVEETTGSRLGSAPRVCKTVEVPVRGATASSQQAPPPNSATGNNL
jgi:CDP-diacylglycerol pyrophosphatase